MRILHVTPHLPPDQAANALLPDHLGEWARARGDSVHYLAQPPRSGPTPSRADVTWIKRTEQTILNRTFRFGSMKAAWRIRTKGVALMRDADLVHLHSNGLLTEVCGAIAADMKKPFVMTLYGTEIWHYRPKRWVPDLFTRAYRAASAVSFYSRKLMERAEELHLNARRALVIYPAVAESFSHHEPEARQRERAALGITAANLLLNVKRLHPLAGQRYLIEAMPAILREHPDTHLVICGTGPLLDELRALARSTGVDARVTFAGLVDNAMVARYCAAADLFVLPSVLEALPTVAVEALASGTPVISSDNPGGVELNGVFGDDVRVVPRENTAALAAAISARLATKSGTSPATRRVIKDQFRAVAVARQYFDLYADVLR